MCMDLSLGYFCVLAVLMDSRKRETYDLKLVHLLDVEVSVVRTVAAWPVAGLTG